MRTEKQVIDLVFERSRLFKDNNKISIYDIEHFDIGFIATLSDYDSEIEEDEIEQFLKDLEELVNSYKRRGYAADSVDGTVYAMPKSYTPLVDFRF